MAATLLVMALLADASTGSSRSKRARSTPSDAAACTRAASLLTCCLYSSNRSRASASVAPVTTVAPRKNLMSSACRPAATASARMSSTMAFTPATLWPFKNTHSACWAAKRRPRGDDPAWYSTGVRWGDGAHRCMASTVYCLPWWCTMRTLAGSAYTPLALSARTASSAQLCCHSW